MPEERIPFAAQKVERIDRVACDFPELEIVLRGGCAPWTRLAVALMRKHPTLSFLAWGAPSEWSRTIVDFANAGGAGRLLFASHAPLPVPFEQVFKELPEVGIGPDAWPAVLGGNARRVFALPA